MLRVRVGVLQFIRKRVISEIGVWLWGYAYILSMGESGVCVENTYSYALFCAAHRWTVNAVGALRHHPAHAPLSNAIVPISSESSRAFLPTLSFCRVCGPFVHRTEIPEGGLTTAPLLYAGYLLTYSTSLTSYPHSLSLLVTATGKLNTPS